MSSRVIYGEENRLLPWARERIGIEFRRDAYTIGLERGGEIVAVVVFDSFSKADCSMHVASDGTSKWMSKSLLLASFAYPFVQLGLRRVTAMVPADNEAALRLDEHLGFVREGYHPHATETGDLVSLGLLREACKFIAPEHRQ
jgi:RimJ/RimL family protein N-acetyltransferase